MVRSSRAALVPKERVGVLGLRIETSSRLREGPFGKWLVIDAIAPGAHFRRDPRASYLFGQFVAAKKTLCPKVCLPPMSLSIDTRLLTVQLDQPR